MSDDILSQAEVESLLNATGPDLPRLPAEANAGPTSRAPGLRPREKATPDDFKKPERVSPERVSPERVSPERVSPERVSPERVNKEQLRALQSLHEGFGRSFAAAMSALLHTIIEVRLTSVAQLTYSEFVFGLENPTCFNLLSAHPLDGKMVLDLNPSILYPIIDRLLGGKHAGPLARRPLTEIELLLVSRITAIFSEELRKAWANVLELEFVVERVESNPQFVQVVPPSEVVVLISFELALGEVRGMMNLCIPFNTIEPLGGKLTASFWEGYSRGGAPPASIETMSRRLEGSRVELVVTLAESTLSTADLIGLRVGDVITTDKDVHSPLRVEIQGIEKFDASPGTFKGKKAIQVLGAIER